MEENLGWGRRRRGWGQLALFLRPAILLFLRQDPSHGYTLIEDLRREGFMDEDLDPAVVYRYMREMEEEGLLTSEWDTSGGGVPRRVYRLTPAGEEFVRGCIVNLRRTRRRLGKIFRLYRQQFPEEGR
ncbi:MAG: helix-turn-helix transcriptional regulator [Chloroflexia bacterium]